MSKSLVLKPRVSEKAYALSQEHNTYVFDVPKSANKQLVAEAVKVQFSVTVETVNIANRKGKAKRTIRKGGRPIAGRQNAIKKAYVTLKAGDTIPVFASAEETEQAATKPAKKEKK